MGFNYRNIARQRANINGPNFMTGSTGCSGIGVRAPYERLRRIRAYAMAPNQKNYVSAANVLSASVGRSLHGRSLMFGSSSDGVRMSTINQQRMKIYR